MHFWPHVLRSYQSQRQCLLFHRNAGLCPASHAFRSQSTLFLSAAELRSRRLLRLQGSDCFDFLQGLITNDVRHLQSHGENSSSLFAFLLNPSGRLIADLMVYKWRTDSLLLEVDECLIATVKHHLTTHRLRKKIAIDEIDEFKVWSLFSPNVRPRVKLSDASSCHSSPTDPDTSSGNGDHVVLVNDPRLPLPFYRLISRSDAEWSSLCIPVTSRLHHEAVAIDATSEQEYRNFRYSIGLSEGQVDHPPLTALPLESNGDYLHAISFFKGCYIGQELTARTYHTGVVRKRLMPIAIQSEDNVRSLPDEWTPGHEFRTEEGRKLQGKIRCVSGDVGLALLYVDLVRQENLTLRLGKTSVQTHIPFWWPNTDPKS